MMSETKFELEHKESVFPDSYVAEYFSSSDVSVLKTLSNSISRSSNTLGTFATTTKRRIPLFKDLLEDLEEYAKGDSKEAKELFGREGDTKRMTVLNALRGPSDGEVALDATEAGTEQQGAQEEEQQAVVDVPVESATGHGGPFSTAVEMW